jgi:hypothetical protein
MIAAMVVPFGWRSIASTASCLEAEGAGAFVDTGFVAAVPGSGVGFDWAEPLALTAPFVGQGDLRTVLADLDLFLLVAIWLSLCERQHLVLPLTQVREMHQRGPKGALRGRDQAIVLSRENLWDRPLSASHTRSLAGRSPAEKAAICRLVALCRAGFADFSKAFRVIAPVRAESRGAAHERLLTQAPA